MLAHEMTNKNKIKIEGHWYKIRRVWVIGEIIEVNTSVGLIRFEKNFEVVAK